MFPAAAKATTGQLAYEPVRRWTRVRLSRFALDDAEGRPTWALHTGCADRALGAPLHRGARLDGSDEQLLEKVKRLLELELPLLEPSLHVAGRPGWQDGREPLIREPRADTPCVRRDPCRPGGGSGGTEPSHVLPAHDTDVGQPILKRAVEEELPPSRSRFTA